MSTSGAAYSSTAELTLRRTKHRTLVQVITIYPNDIKNERYFIQVATALLVAGSTVTFWIPLFAPFVYCVILLMKGVGLVIA